MATLNSVVDATSLLATLNQPMNQIYLLTLIQVTALLVVAPSDEKIVAVQFKHSAPTTHPAAPEEEEEPLIRKDETHN